MDLYSKMLVETMESVLVACSNLVASKERKSIHTPKVKTSNLDLDLNPKLEVLHITLSVKCISLE